MRALFNSKPILSFILLTFLITFFFWFLPVVVSLPKDINLGIILIGGFGPAIAAFILLHINSGIKLKIELKSRFWLFSFLAILIISLATIFVRTSNSNSWDRNLWNGLNEVSIVGMILLLACCFFWGLMMSNSKNINLRENYLKSFLFDNTIIRWYVFAILFFPASYTLSYAFGKLFDLETSGTFFTPDGFFVLTFLLTFFFTGAPEEFGWRGFLQKELQKKYNPLVVSLIISFLWSFWHLPLHYNGLYSTGGFMDLLPRFIWMIPYSIIFTWLYNKSSYSILAVVILHAMLNNTSKALGYSEIVLTVLVILLCVYCIIDDKMWKKKSYHLVYQSENNKGQQLT